jgi:HNH endonuclease
MKTCDYCRLKLVRRQNEELARWKRRMFCNRTCSDLGRYQKAEAGAIERFMKFVIPEPMSGCWLWLGNLTRGNYGRFRFHTKEVRASRASYEFFKGNIPADLLVRHRCDNSYCVNPDHLEIGTHQDNYDDMVRRGRAAFQQQPN